MLLHALYEQLCTAPLNQLRCYGALEVIVTLLLLFYFFFTLGIYSELGIGARSQKKN